MMCRTCISMVRSQHDSALGEGLKLAVSSNPKIRQEMCDAWEARMLNYWRRCFTAIDQHKGDCLGQYQALKPIGDEEQKNDSKPGWELEAILMPVFSRADLSVVQSEAQHRLRLGLLALMRYRNVHGSYPQSLSHLPDPLPPDPFTGKALLYRKTPVGFVLYSVGMDFKDDGGMPRGPDGKGMPDVVIQDPKWW